MCPSNERTAKNTSGEYVTKTEVLSLESAQDALKAVEAMERSLPGWEKLADEMLADMRETQDRLGKLSKSVSEVVADWHGLLQHVLVTLH